MSNHPGKKILVVDDQPQIAALVAAILQRRGFPVLTAEGPHEAIRLFEQEQAEIGLLLTDIVMPGMSGIQLASQLAAARPELPVIYMSGAVLDDQQPRNRPFLRKPFQPDELVQCVRTALDDSSGLP